MAGVPMSFSGSGGHAGPSNAGSYGDTGGMGQTIGDYYGSGSRVRQSSGWGWKEIAVVGVVAVAGLVVIEKLGIKL